MDGLRSGEVLAGDRHFGRRVEAQIKKPLGVTPGAVSVMNGFKPPRFFLPGPELS